MINEEKIKELLSHRPEVIQEIFVYGLTDSTSTRAREYSRSIGELSGTVLFLADGQTMGRGRLGKSFHSALGAGIYMTLLISPEKMGVDPSRITAESAVKLSRAVERMTGRKMKIKWINDVYARANDGEKYKKLAGILAESETDSEGKIKYLYLGLGINVYKAALPDEISDIAISLEELTGKKFSREDLIAEILTELLSPADPQGLYREYCRRSLTLGKQITVRPTAKAPYPATAVKISEDFSLIVKLPDGSLERIFTGEVSTEL